MPLPCMPAKVRRNAGLMQEPLQIWRPASPRSGRLNASGTRERHDLDYPRSLPLGEDSDGCPPTICPDLRI